MLTEDAHPEAADLLQRIGSIKFLYVFGQLPVELLHNRLCDELGILFRQVRELGANKMAPCPEHGRVVDLKMNVRDLFFEGNVKDLIKLCTVHDVLVPPRSIVVYNTFGYL